MKIVKRDGRIVDYDSDKIRIAIGKANAELDEENQISAKEIEKIILHIERLKKKRMLVEDIQDIIEEKLMALGKFELAKHYIIYRYTRALVRKANTTDETILSLIKNSNRTQVEKTSNRRPNTASAQRDLIAGEISKDITKRILLPEKISKAHDEGKIYFHDMDYFLQPVINSCIINIKDMLDNGTVMNNKFIQSPKSFQVACTVMTQIIALVASGQYGAQAIEIKHLGKYLRKSYDKYKLTLESKYANIIEKEKIEELVKDRVQEELTSGVQTIQYQINTLMTTSGKEPYVTLFLSLDEDDPYIEENARIIEEILKQRIEGIQNEEGKTVTLEFPKLVYLISENNCLNGGKYDYLTELAIKSTLYQGYPDYLFEKQMKDMYKGNVYTPIGSREFLSIYKEDKNKFEGRFTQGTVTLNLPQIALESEKDEEMFWNILDERLDLCFEALMCRHHSLLGTNSDISPIHWQNGAIARLAQGEKIDRYLKNGYSALMLGYIGLYETVKHMTGYSQLDQEGMEFSISIMKKLKDTCDRWCAETGLAFNLYATEPYSIGKILVDIDYERYGKIKDVTDKESYTDSYHISSKENISYAEKIDVEKMLEAYSTGGKVSIINIEKDLEKIKDVINVAKDNIVYLKLKLRG